MPDQPYILVKSGLPLRILESDKVRASSDHQKAGVKGSDQNLSKIRKPIFRRFSISTPIIYSWKGGYARSPTVLQIVSSKSIYPPPYLAPHPSSAQKGEEGKRDKKGDHAEHPKSTYCPKAPLHSPLTFEPPSHFTSLFTFSHPIPSTLRPFPLHPLPTPRWKKNMRTSFLLHT
ncbi:hypothetical protein AKJ57_02740 [candidate division MSBL1 archaeon SCGC-AAA259A05]|uniref:Uncharacterized protein n=1 Tax=candidate division MSBL1 archaeon SCGC-AAA259A05 TaxID=1698259 RepID=A0A133UA51_9EURY|nr:hypothetical protein AKJ57_02740 [candidate division MSBL1 archaeon SCGC-AAA259A05]